MVKMIAKNKIQLRFPMCKYLFIRWECWSAVQWEGERSGQVLGVTQVRRRRKDREQWAETV